MQGSVRKRGTTWSYRIDFGKIDGKRRQIEKGGYKNKKEALKKQLLQNGKIFSSKCPKPHENIYSQIHTTDGLFNMPCI